MELLYQIVLNALLATSVLLVLLLQVSASQPPPVQYTVLREAALHQRVLPVRIVHYAQDLQLTVLQAIIAL